MDKENIYQNLNNLLKRKDFESLKKKTTNYLQEYKDDIGLLEFLAVSLTNLKEWENAIAIYLKLLTVNSNSITINISLARLYDLLERYVDANIYYLNCLRLDNNFLLKMEYGVFLTKYKKYSEALIIFNECIDLDQNNFLPYFEIGNLFLKDKKFINAINYYKQSIEKNKNFYKSYSNMAAAYNHLGRTKDAIVFYKKSIEVDSSIFLNYSNLGLVLQSQGDFAEAIENFNKALLLNPNDGETHRYLSVSQKYTKDHPHIQKMIEILKNTHDDKNRISLNFALAKAMEDSGLYEQASKYLNDGNYLQRLKFKNFSIDSVIKQFELLSKTFSYNFVSKKTNFKNNKPHSVPIFILGMPRSGTTLAEQILSSHTEVYGCGEINDLTDSINAVFTSLDTKKMMQEILKASDYKFEKIAKNYLDSISQKTNKNFITDKMPFNFKVIGIIKRCFPDAKIIHCYRNKNDNLLSIYKNFFNQDIMPWAYDAKELNLYYQSYAKLLKHYKLILDDYIFDLEYENLTRNPKQVIEKLLSFCNLSWQDNCLNIENNNKPIFTASVTQARQKINTNSIESWKRFEQYIPNLFIKN